MASMVCLCFDKVFVTKFINIEISWSLRMNNKSIYLTLDHENGLVMGLGKSNQVNLRSKEIVLEKAVELNKLLSDNTSPRSFFTSYEFKRLYKEYSSNIVEFKEENKEYKIKKAGIILQFVEQLDYLWNKLK